MKNLEDAQREMRERNARKKREENLVQPEIAASDDKPEVLRLKSQISTIDHREQSIATAKDDRRRATSRARANLTGILLRNNSTTSLSTATREDTSSSTFTFQCGRFPVEQFSWHVE